MENNISLPTGLPSGTVVLIDGVTNEVIKLQPNS